MQAHLRALLRLAQCRRTCERLRRVQHMLYRERALSARQLRVRSGQTLFGLGPDHDQICNFRLAAELDLH